ncbi:MAG: glycosyltransferase [Acidobacteriota bacterium]
MRVLIQSLGSAGDVHPFIAIGQALRDRGHDVVLLSNGLFADAVEAAGLSFVETGTAEEFQATAAKPELWHPTKGLDLVLDEGVFPSLEPTIDLLRQHLTDDTILVGSTLGFAARLVSELEDRPLATVHLAPTAFRTAHRMPVLPGMPAGPSSPRWLKRLSWWLIRKITDGKIAPRLNSTRRRLGLPPVSDVFFDWLHSPQRVLATWPEWFAPRPAGLAPAGPTRRLLPPRPRWSCRRARRPPRLADR